MRFIFTEIAKRRIVRFLNFHKASREPEKSRILSLPQNLFQSTRAHIYNEDKSSSRERFIR